VTTTQTETPLLDAIAAGPSKWPNPSRLRCADGTVLSVIVGEHLYCSPRDNHGPYFAVEVGTWVPVPSTWAEYADYEHGEDEAGDHLRVHGYVPVHLVRALILEHGGEAEDQTVKIGEP
jgi:hypothetical protein